VSAAIDASGVVVPGTVVHSEVGGACRVISPWVGSSGSEGGVGGGGGGGGGGAVSGVSGGGGDNPPFAVHIMSGVGGDVAVARAGTVGRGVAIWTFNTTANTTYVLTPSGSTVY
jgi:hypothetical protein